MFPAGCLHILSLTYSNAALSVCGSQSLPASAATSCKRTFRRLKLDGCRHDALADDDRSNRFGSPGQVPDNLCGPRFVCG